METAAYIAHMYRTVVWLQRDKGWGPWVKVTVADTPEADAAALAFFQRVCAYTPGETYHCAHVDEEHTEALGSALSEYFYPTCPHGLSAHLCYGPDHYPREDQM